MEKILATTQKWGIRAEVDCPLSAHCTFGVGGPANLAVFPTDREELLLILAAVREGKVPYLVIGNGSNILFDDRGYPGVVIFTGGCKTIRREGPRLIADAGAMLGSVARFAQEKALAGVEFAEGIPGTVGGAVFMNAGAFGGTVGAICASSTYYDSETGRIGVFAGAEQKFGEKTSVYEQNPRYTVLGAELTLTEDDPAAIRSRMEDYKARRKASQPLEFRSAGSFFKRPAGHYAGKLIEDCGLKGKRIGGAEVSVKHAGFLLNRGGATADEIKALAELVQNTVLRETGILLEREVRYV